VSYDLIFGLPRRREPAEVVPRSSSLPRLWEGVCGDRDVLAPRFDGDRSKRVGGCRRIAVVIARTGLGCGSGNSARVDVARLGFICASVTKFGLKGFHVRRGPDREKFGLGDVAHRLGFKGDN